jgi:hypothetical protein
MCHRFVIAVGFGWLLLVTQLPAENKLQPFSVDWSEADRSIVDLSRFLRAPAGRDGFLRVVNGHLALPDGTRFRAWGVNAPFDVCFVTKELAPLVADDFARLGFNCVRFHHLDVPWGANIFDPRHNDTQHLNAEMIDRLDFLIAELKKRGIYFTLTFNVHREFKLDDGVTDHEQLGMGKPAYYFDPRIQALYLQFVRQLLTHRNPYTGNEYRNEPALAWLELLNENSLIEAWAQWRLMVPEQPKPPHTWSPISESYSAELTRQWTAWQESHIPGDTRRAWAAVFGSNPDQPIPRSQPHDWSDKCVEEHYLAELEFYMHLERDFFARARQLIRDELAAKPLLIGDGDHNDSISPYPHALSFNLCGDFLDGHGYWQHPDLGPPLQVKNTPMVNEPLDSTVVQFARTPVEGRPFTISETNHPFPHRYACEGLPILSAYALFQDWDGLLWFDWGPGRIRPGEGVVQVFGFGSDPLKYANAAVCGLWFHRGDVQPAQQTVVRHVSHTTALDSLRWNRDQERPFYTRGFSKSTPLLHAVRWKLTEDPAPAYPEPAPLGEMVSDTGELTWRHADKRQGLVTLDTPRAQALIGFVRDHPPALKNMRVEVDNEFCAVLCTSLDDLPIAESAQLLLVTTAKVENSGMAWQADGTTVADWGHLPMTIEPVTGTITLTGLGSAKQVIVQPLSAVGVPLGQTVIATPRDADWSFSIGGTAVTTWYLVQVARNTHARNAGSDATHRVPGQ